MATSDSPLGTFIRQQRELQHLTVRGLATMVGISNPYLSQIENGLRAPSQQVLDAIAASLHMSAEALRKEAGLPDDQVDDAANNAVVDAIHADKQLSGAQRRALIEIYRSFRE